MAKLGSKWTSPYHLFDLYCPACGTVFRIIRMREPFSYCVLPSGPCDVFGGIEPRIDHLSENLRDRLYKIWEEFKVFSETLPESRFDPVLLVRGIETFEMKLPARNPQQLCTFISARALKEHEGITVSCNCGFMSVILPKPGETINEMRCWACGARIKLMALEPGDGYFFVQREGKKRVADIQSSRALPAWRLSEGDERDIINGADANPVTVTDKNPVSS